MSILQGLQFGSGIILASPLATSGNPAPNPTPLTVGVIQNVKFSLGAELKTLFGQNQWPVDSAVGKRTIKGSFEFAQISNILLSQLFTGDSVAAGIVEVSGNGNGEDHPIPGTPFQVVVAPPSSGVFLNDLGVIFSATGVPLTKVPLATTPTTGQYHVDPTSGTYTFAAADTLLHVTISYSYTIAAAGTTLTAANHPMGYGPVLALSVVFPYEAGGGNNAIGFYFPNVRLGKLDIATKLDDYNMITTDFEAFAGAGGVPFQSFQAW
jgi:hypothetical protein